MKMKKLISFLCAAALTVSSFAGLAVTASADAPKSVTVAVDAGDTTANVTTTESSAVTGVLLLAKYTGNALTSLKVSPSFTTPANDVALGAAYADGDKLMAWEDLASMKPITVTKVAKPVPKTQVNTVADVAITRAQDDTYPATLTATVTAKQDAQFTDTTSFTYSWSKDGVAVNGGENGTLTAATAGSYTVTATYNNSEGDFEGTITSAPFSVEDPTDTRTSVADLVTVTITAAENNTKTPTTLTATVADVQDIATPTGLTADDFTYVWTKDDETVDGATTKTLEVAAGGAGEYKVVATVKSDNATYKGSTPQSAGITIKEPIVGDPYVSGTAPEGATIRAVSVNVDDDSKALTYKELVEGEVKTTENTKDGADHNETYVKGALLAQKNSKGESPVIVRIDKGDIDLTGKKAYIKFTAKTNFGSSDLTLSTATAPTTDDIAALTGETKLATGTQLKKWGNASNENAEVEITSLFDNDTSVVWFVINSASIRIQNITNLEFVVKAPHNVTVDSNITGGTITPDKATALQGETVTLTVAPAAGKELQADSLKVNNGAVTVEAVGVDYRFTMPDADATITATFIDETTPKYAVTLTGVPGYAQVYTSTDGETYTTNPVARTNHLGQIVQLGDGTAAPTSVDATNILIARQPNNTALYYKITKSGYPDKTGSVTPNGAAVAIDASSMAPTAAGVLYSENGDWNNANNASTMGGGTCRGDTARIRWQNNNAVVTLNTDSLTADKYALDFTISGWGTWQAKETTYTFRDAADKTLATLKFAGVDPKTYATESDKNPCWGRASSVVLTVGGQSETISAAATPAVKTDYVDAAQAVKLTVDKTTGAVTLKFGDTTVSGTVADAGMIKSIAMGGANLQMVTNLITVSTYTPVTPAAKTITWENTLTGFTVKKGNSEIATGATLAANDVITIEATDANKKVKSVTATGATFTVTDGVASATVGATPADIVITAVELENKTPATQATTATITAVDANTDLYGKKLADLTDSFTITGTDKAYTAKGTLKYVTGYTDFSSNVAEQSGNYLPFAVNVEGYNTNSTIKIKGNAVGSAENTYTYADCDDGVFVFILGGQSTSLSIKVDRDGSGTAYEETEYTLSWTKATTAGDADKLYFTPATQATTATIAAVDANKDLYGKKLADLTDNFAITGTDKAYKATGTLKYVTGYTGFSSNAAEQSGNYLPFVVNVEGYNTNSTIKIKGDAEGSAENTYTYEDCDDGVFVFILGGQSTSLSIKVDRDGSGNAYEETEYTLSWTKAETAGETDKLYFTPAPTPLTGAAITGTAKLGETLTAATTPANATVTYQWQRAASAEAADADWADIDEATAATYSPVEADYQKYLRVVATGTGSYTGTVKSTATAQVAEGLVPLSDGDVVEFTLQGEDVNSDGKLKIVTNSYDSNHQVYLYATSAKPFDVANASNTTINNNTYNKKYVKTGGMGTLDTANESNTTRVLKVKTVENGVLEVDFGHGGSAGAEARYLTITQDSDTNEAAVINQKIGDVTENSNYVKIDVEKGKDIYITSGNSSLSIFGIRFTADADVTDTFETGYTAIQLESDAADAGISAVTFQKAGGEEIAATKKDNTGDGKKDYYWAKITETGTYNVNVTYADGKGDGGSVKTIEVNDLKGVKTGTLVSATVSTEDPDTIAVTPATATVKQGETKQFAATVTKGTSPVAEEKSGVTWSVTGNTSSNTKFSTETAGLLEIGADETGSLTVTATSTEVNTVKGTATVTVEQAEDTVTLTYTKSDTAKTPIEGAVVTPTVVGYTLSSAEPVFEQAGTTDENGQVTLKLNPNKYYNITAALNGETINTKTNFKAEGAQDADKTIAVAAAPNTANAAENGEYNLANVIPGETVEITPAEGKVVKSITYTPTEGSATAATKGDNGKYTFKMPDEGVSAITITYATASTATIKAFSGEVWGKATSAMSSDLNFGTAAENVYTPTGTIKYIDFAAFSDNAAYQKGNYLSYYVDFGAAYPNAKVTAVSNVGDTTAEADAVGDKTKSDDICTILLPEAEYITVTVDLDGDGTDYAPTAYKIDLSGLEINPAPQASTATVTTSTSETAWKGHSPKELGTFTVQPTTQEGYDYELVGTANYIADYTGAFGTEDGVDMTKGYYIPFSIDIPSTVADPTKAVLTYKSSAATKTYTYDSFTTEDRNCTVILFLNPDATYFTYTIDWDGEGEAFTAKTYKVYINQTGTSAETETKLYKAPQPVTNYTITLPTGLTGGSVAVTTPDDYNAETGVAAGTNVVITATPASGYQVKSLTVKNGEDTVEGTAAADNTTYTFEMPAGNVTVTAQFEMMYVSAADGKIQAVSLYGGTDEAKNMTYSQLISNAITTTGTDGGPNTYSAGKLYTTGSNTMKLILRIDGSSFDLDNNRVILGATVSTTSDRGVAKHDWCIMAPDNTPADGGDLSALTHSSAGARQASKGTFPALGVTNPTLDITSQLASDSDHIIYMFISMNGDNNTREHIFSNLTLTATPVYAVTVNNPTGGTITPNVAKAAAGDTVTLTNTPDSGYDFASYTVTDSDEQPVTVDAEGKFTMPAKTVTVTGSFTAKVPTTLTVTPPASTEVIAGDTTGITYTAVVKDQNEKAMTAAEAPVAWKVYNAAGDTEITDGTVTVANGTITATDAATAGTYTIKASVSGIDTVYTSTFTVKNATPATVTVNYVTDLTDVANTTVKTETIEGVFVGEAFNLENDAYASTYLSPMFYIENTTPENTSKRYTLDEYTTGDYAISELAATNTINIKVSTDNYAYTYETFENMTNFSDYVSNSIGETTTTSSLFGIVDTSTDKTTFAGMTAAGNGKALVMGINASGSGKYFVYDKDFGLSDKTKLKFGFDIESHQIRSDKDASVTLRFVDSEGTTVLDINVATGKTLNSKFNGTVVNGFAKGTVTHVETEFDFSGETKTMKYTLTNSAGTVLTTGTANLTAKDFSKMSFKGDWQYGKFALDNVYIGYPTE